MTIFCLVDDKHVPLYRVVWVAATPHFCGAEDCQREGYYEVRLDGDDSVWANRMERDSVLEAIERWQGDLDPPEDDEEEDEAS